MIPSPEMTPDLEPTDEERELAEEMLPPPDPSQRVELVVDLDEEERRELGFHLCQEIDRYYNDTARRRDNLRTWRRDYDLYPSGEEGPWPDSADITAPLTHIACNAHTTRLNSQIIRSIPPLTVVARKEEAQFYVSWIEECIVSRMEEANWEQVAMAAHTELPIAGNVGLRVTYEQETMRVPVLQWEFNEENWVALLNAGVDPETAFYESIEMDSDGMPKSRLEWETRIKRQGVCMKVVPWEDMIVLPVTVRDPKEARGIGERLMIRGTELHRGAKAGIYYEDEVEELLKMPGDDEPEDRVETLEYQGISGTNGNEIHRTSNDSDDDRPNLYDNYLCYELCWQGDYNGDGEDEWVVVTLHKRTGRVLRCAFLPWEHGRPHYYLMRYFIRPRELFAMSVAEKLAGLQDAASSTFNAIQNHADLIANAGSNFFYDNSAGLDDDEFVWTMGRPVKVDNAAGIQQFNITPLSPEHYNVLNQLKDWCDLLSATSNPTLGKPSQGDKTLGEVQIVANASNAMFEEFAAGVSYQWAEVLDMFRWLEAQFGEGGEVKYRVTAAPGKSIELATGEQMPVAMAQGGQQMLPAPGGVAFTRIPAHILMSEVDLVMTGMKQLADMASQTQQATIVMSVLQSHPLTMQNLEVQLIGLDQYLQAVRYPHRERIMNSVHMQFDAIIAQQQAMAQMQVAAAFGTPMPPGMMPPQPGAGMPGALGPEHGGGGQQSAAGQGAMGAPSPLMAPPGAPTGAPPGMGLATGPGGMAMPPQPGGMRKGGR